MKRYLLFTMHEHEASGGWNDFVDSFDSVEEAVAAVKDPCYQVVDVTIGKVVRQK